MKSESPKEENVAMKSKGDKGTVAGALSIVAGAMGVISGISIVVIMIFSYQYFSNPAFVPYPPRFSQQFLTMILVIYVTMGFIILLIGVLGIIGGIFSLRRKHWGAALAGAIAGSITFWPCGIIALIFISLGKSEFDIIQLNIQ